MALFLLKKRRKTRLEETNMNRNTLAALSLTASLSLTLALSLIHISEPTRH